MLPNFSSFKYVCPKMDSFFFFFFLLRRIHSFIERFLVPFIFLFPSPIISLPKTLVDQFFFSSLHPPFLNIIIIFRNFATKHNSKVRIHLIITSSLYFSKLKVLINERTVINQNKNKKAEKNLRIFKTASTICHKKKKKFNGLQNFFSIL